MKLRNILVLSLMFVFVATSAFAETVYMKDGNVFKGRIVERGHNYIKLMQGRIPKKLFNAQIDRIDEDDYVLKTNIDMLKFPDIPEKKVVLIVRLIEINGARQKLEEAVLKSVAQAPPENQARIKEAFGIDSIIEQFVPIYAQYFSEKELKELITFYESATGQRLLEVTPLILKESMEKTVEHFKKVFDPANILSK